MSSSKFARQGVKFLLVGTCPYSQEPLMPDEDDVPASAKPKTLEMFGIALPADAEGKVKHRPFHSYTMKQAIEERFILDVLKAYTPVNSYFPDSSKHLSIA